MELLFWFIKLALGVYSCLFLLAAIWKIINHKKYGEGDLSDIVIVLAMGFIFLGVMVN